MSTGFWGLIVPSSSIFSLLAGCFLEHLRFTPSQNLSCHRCTAQTRRHPNARKKNEYCCAATGPIEEKGTKDLGTPRVESDGVGLGQCQSSPTQAILGVQLRHTYARSLHTAARTLLAVAMATASLGVICGSSARGRAIQQLVWGHANSPKRPMELGPFCTVP